MEKPIRTFTQGEAPIQPSLQLSANIEKILGERSGIYYSLTCIEGRLHTVSKDGSNHFEVTHSISNNKITCRCSAETLEEVRSDKYFDKRVSVRGKAKYKSNGKLDSIEVESVEALPDPTTLPKYKDLPKVDLTGGTDSAEHVRRIREAN